MKKPKSNGLKEETHSGNIVKKFKGMVYEGPFYVCQICHRCLNIRSVQHFERNIKNEPSNPINIFPFDGCLYICNTCRTKSGKGKVRCQSVPNKLEVYNFISHFCGIPKLKKYLLQKEFSSKRLLSCHMGKWKKIPVQFVICSSILLMSQICYHDLLTAVDW